MSPRQLGWRSALLSTALAAAAGLTLLASPASAAFPCQNGDQGTIGGDRLIGTVADDALRGGGGDDVMEGRAAPDCLNGGVGRDSIKAGDGRDKISTGMGRDRVTARDGQRDVLKCGTGRDRARVDQFDRTVSCNNVSMRKVKHPGPKPDPDPDPVPDPDPEPSNCEVDLAALVTSSCDVLASDTSEVADPEALWGNIECETEARVARGGGGDDPHRTATGAAQGDNSFRQVTVRDGDDFYGERCELGRNEHRYESPSSEGTFQVYREGQRRLTFISMRLSEDFPIETTKWQTLIQMKQAQPSAGGGGGPILELQAYDGRFWLINDWNELWSVPATTGVWTRFAFDVTYSQDADRGSVRLYVDANGDGDAADPGEQSPTFSTETLKREVGGGWSGDGVDPGESIPSHLRTGIYHDAAIPCPTGCEIDVDNVQVVKPS